MKHIFLAKEPAPPQDNSHLEVTFVALKDTVKQYVSTLTDDQLLDQYKKYAHPHSPHHVPNEYYIPALTAELRVRPPKSFPFAVSAKQADGYNNYDAFVDAGNYDGNDF